MKRRYPKRGLADQEIKKKRKKDDDEDAGGTGKKLRFFARPTEDYIHCLDVHEL